MTARRTPFSGADWCLGYQELQCNVMGTPERVTHCRRKVSLQAVAFDFGAE